MSGCGALVFDSGIGGLGVVAALRRLEPSLPLAYLADNAGFPYGEQPDDVLLCRLASLLGRAIAALRPDAVVIACNTASTIALAALRGRFQTPFIGCVPPIKPAAAASRSGQIGLLATPATIRRPYLQGLIAAHGAGATVHALGAPRLAALAEETFVGRPADPAALAAILAPLFAGAGGGAIDAIALGCTHYSFLLPELIALRPGVAYFDPAEPVARQTLKVMAGRRFAPMPATAWFTAPPAAALTARLPSYGFANAALFSHSDAGAPAAPIC